MARVLVSVMNSVTFDARVLRQAASLRSAGHDVQIVGLRRTRDDKPEETLENGVRILRLGTPRPTTGRRSRRRSEPAPAAPVSVDARPGPPAVEPRVGRHWGEVGWLRFAVQGSGAPASIAWFHVRQTLRDRSFAASLRHLSADVVHTHDVGALPLGVRLARARGVPLIFDAHEVYDQDNSSARHRAKSERDAHTIARLASDVAGFITVNDSLSDYYAAHFPLLPRATTLPNASPVLSDVIYDGRLHEAGGWSRGTKVILYQGVLNTARCLPALARSAALLPDGWAVAFLGQGALTGHLETMREELPTAAQQRLGLLGRVPASELPAWTSGATLGFLGVEPGSINQWFCSPNRLWAYPQVDVPVLASALPELERVVGRYGCGWLLPAHITPQAIAEAVRALDDAQFVAARAGCRSFIKAEAWDQHEPKLLELYDRLLRDKPT